MKNTQAISVTIPIELAETMNKIQKKKMKNYSAIVTEALTEYLLKEEYETQINKMSKSAAKTGILTPEDIDKLIHEARRENKKQ